MSLHMLYLCFSDHVFVDLSFRGSIVSVTGLAKELEQILTLLARKCQSSFEESKYMLCLWDDHRY